MATNSQRETPEYRIFRENYDRLVHAIQEPLPLATRLFSQGIITSAVKERMIVLGLSRLEKNSALLSAVEMQIQTNPCALCVFLSALDEDPSLQALVESIQRGLLSTTSGAHEGESVESRDGGEEQSTPAVKRKCVHAEETMSLVSVLERESVHGDSVTLPSCFSHQHQRHQCQNQQHFHSSCQPPIHSHNAPFHPPPPHQYQSPVQPHVYQPQHYPAFHFPLELPSHQCTEPSQHSCYQPPPNPPPLQHASLPTSGTHYQQPYYQSHYHVPFQPEYMYEPPYQRPPPHHSPLPQGKYTYKHLGYHQTSTFQSSQLPSFQLHQTPFHSFCQSNFQAPHQQPTRLAHSQPLSPPPPHPDSPLVKYAQFLRAYYTQHHAPCTKWPQLHTRKYINLAVISNVYANREDLVKFRKQTIRGSIDDILEWKAPIAMREILQPNCLHGTPCPITQLLIEGAPGIGKSTFAWEVCQKWGQHQLFNEFLVLLLKFRDKRVQEAESIFNLFYHPNPKLQSDIVDDITETGGYGLLLILEGFDEAPALKRTMDSIFVRLFRGQELPSATVILTTRPSASGELRQFCNSVNSRRIEILGFGKKEIDEYIQCAFSDEQSRSDFKEYLSLYPYIHSMMYVPLNSAIVTHVYESCKSSSIVVPKTMTQLYSSLIRTLLLRYLNDKEEYKDTCTNINSFKDLPQPVCDQFCEICKIAYTGIVSAETELIFQDLPSDFEPLGLMQSCPELYVDRGARVSYNFLHSTLQEYLAAYHISQQSRDEQLAFMREHIGSKNLEVVVRFLAGLSELGRDLWDVVRGIASEARPIFLPLLEEETNFIKLISLHCLFESQDSSVITSILGPDCVCFSGGSWIDKDALQPFDVYVLGYCITHSSCDWKLELEHFELESVEIFLKVLNLQQDQRQLPSTGQIRKIWLNGSDLAAGHLLVDNIPQMSVFSKLTHLCLRGSYLTSETCNLLSKYTELLQHLEYLELGHNPIGRGGAVNLIISLSKFSTITELKLDSNGLGFEDCKALSDLLASSKYIEELHIYSEVNDIDNLSPDSVQLIVDSLFHNTSLEKLNIYHSDFSSENVFHLASVLRVNTRLKELDIGSCDIQSSDSVHLAKALEESTTTQLHTLVLGGNPIGSEGAVAFTGMLAANKSLAKLNMTYCSIQREGAVAIASVLKRNQCLKSLTLIDDGVGVEGALELIKSLKHNTTLEKLWLSEQCRPPSFSTLDKELQDRVRFGE